MLTLDEIVERLNRKDVNYTHVQRETGLGYQTIRNIAMGRSSDPKLSTMMKLSEYLVKL